MQKSNVLKRILFDYIMVQAEITLSMALIGTIFVKDIQISYSYFFLPFLLAALCMLPCLIIYLNESLTIRQVMIQRTIQLIVLEAVVMGFVYFLAKDVPGVLGYVVIALSVIVIDVGTYLLEWYYEREEAQQLNEILKKYRKI